MQRITKLLVSGNMPIVDTFFLPLLLPRDTVVCFFEGELKSRDVNFQMRVICKLSVTEWANHCRFWGALSLSRAVKGQRPCKRTLFGP